MDAGAIPPPSLPSHRSHVSTPAVGSPESDIEIVFEGIELWTKRYRHAVAKLRALKRGPDFENALRGLKSEQADIWKTLKGKKKSAKVLIEALGTADRREYYNGELEELRAIYLKVEAQYWAALAVVDPASVTDARDTGRLADRPDAAADAPLLPGALPPPTTADAHVAAVRREVETYKRVVAAFKALPYNDDFADAATPLLSERAEVSGCRGQPALLQLECVPCSPSPPPTQVLVAYNERRETARAFVAGLRDPLRRSFFERELAHAQDTFREEDNAFWTARRAAARAILLDGTLALGSGATGHAGGAAARGRPTNTTLLASALATERRTTKALLVRKCARARLCGRATRNGC